MQLASMGQPVIEMWACLIGRQGAVCCGLADAHGGLWAHWCGWGPLHAEGISALALTSRYHPVAVQKVAF